MSTRLSTLLSAPDNGVGTVPARWERTRLRYAARLNPSRSEVADFPPSTLVSFLPMEAIGEDGSMQLDQTRDLASVSQGYTYFRDGDVVIAKITPCFENGKGALVKGLVKGIGFGTTELIVVRAIPGVSDPAFLHWLFVSPDFRLRATASMYGAGGQKRVPDDYVRDFIIGLPPPDEQQAIVSFLDRETGKIDALVAEQERLIALLKEKRQAVITQAVTKGLDPTVPMKDSGVEWLGEVPARWQRTRLRHVTWLNPSKSEVAHLPTSTMVSFLPMEAIGEDGSLQTDQTRELSSVSQGYTYFRDGDVVVAKITPCFENGKGALIDGLHGGIGFGTTELIVVRAIPAASHPAFLHWLFVSPHFRLRATASMYGAGGQKRVPDDFVRDFAIGLPPLNEQRAIAAFLDRATAKIDALVAEQERLIALVKERRSALISAAVTGKIDVRNLVPESLEAA